MPYYVRINGRSHGPFDESKLLELKSRGTISRTTEVSENDRDWCAAETFEFLYSVPLPPPPHNDPATQELFESKPPMEPPVEIEYRYGGTTYQSSEPKQDTSRGTQEESPMMRQILDMTNPSSSAESFVSWLCDFAFRKIRLETTLVWTVRIFHAIGFAFITVLFLSGFGLCFVSVTSEGASPMLILMIPVFLIPYCLFFLLLYVFHRNFWEYVILFGYGVINLSYLIRGTRIYVNKLNAELESRIPPQETAVSNTDIFLHQHQ